MIEPGQWPVLTDDPSLFGYTLTGSTVWRLHDLHADFS